MAALPYMQLYIADYLADTMHLSTEEHGAYLLLMFNYWQTGRAIPKSRLSKIARISNDRWDSVENSLKEFFNDNGTEWVHERIERDLEMVRSSQRQKSEAGKASAKAKKAKKETELQRNGSDRSTLVEHSLEQRPNENSTNKDTDTDTDTKDKTILPDGEKNATGQGGDFPDRDEPIFITLPLNTGEEFPVTELMVAEWQELYPAVNVQQELRKQRGWLLANSRNRKTRQGVKKFINSWLAKTQDSPGAAGLARNINVISQTDSTIPPGFRG